MSEPIVDSAVRFLRSHSKGELRFDEHVRPVKYIVAPDGHIVAPVMVAMLEAVDTVLFVPQWTDNAMELQATLEEFSDRGLHGALADRWRIYHGQPDDVKWAILHPDAARFETSVIDGDAIIRPNPLTADEPAVCRTWNQNRRDDLRRITQQFGQMEVEKPVMVGIDPDGIDIRAMFDVVRVPTTEPMPTAAEAQRVLNMMASSTLRT